MHKHHTKVTGQARTDIDKLCKDPSVQHSYQEQLHNTLTKHHLSQDPIEALTNLLDYMKTSAAKTIRELKGENSTQHIADPTATKLSEQPKALRLRIYQYGKGKERNNFLRLTPKRLKEVALEEADALEDCRKMFRAAKQLCSTKPTPPIIFQDTDGNLMGMDNGKERATKYWFQQ